MICPVCLINPIKPHPLYGALPCFSCEERRSILKSPDTQVEFTSNSIKSERKEYSKDILQPHRGNEPSLEFMEAYPEKAKTMFTKKEIKNARKVWN